MKKVFVWDLPVRLFHWTLFIVICVSFYTGATGGFTEMDYHMIAGYVVLALVLFRIIWGFVGGRNARFTSFVKGPGAIRDYLKGDGEQGIGHNPLGALSVIALLVALLVQAGTGLFANDDIMIEGPLAHLVSYDTSRTLTGIHEINRFIVLGLIILHVLAIAYYHIFRKHNLIGPMITGYLKTNKDAPAEQNNYWIAVIVLGGVSGLVYWLVNYL